jgi:hypothetical protein
MSFSESEVPRRRAASFRTSDKENELASLDEDAKEVNGEGGGSTLVTSQPIPIK